MADVIVRSTTLVLALVLLWAGAIKLTRFEVWRRALALYSLPARLERTARGVVPLAEVATAVMLILEPRAGGAATLVMTASFSAAILRARALEGDRLPCGCFGGSGRRDYRLLLGRNALMAAGAIVVAGTADVRPLDGVGVPAAGDLVPALLGAVGVALAVWAGVTASELFRRGNR